MDAKITLSFDEAVINKAKAFADANNISVSRLVEFLLRKTVHSHNLSLDQLPVADWVGMVSKGEVVYERKPANRSAQKSEYRERKKRR
jgi:antitoxin component of RelBE/YafQ-DinJ toxin-antitoxin module